MSLLWRILAAPQTLMALLVLCAAALALSTCIPQVPPQSRGDIQAWLAVQSSAMPQGTALFETLGLFDVLHSVWFRVLFTVTWLALLVWLVESAELAYRLSGQARSSPAVLAEWASRAPVVDLSSALPLPDVQARAQARLLERGFECGDTTDSEGGSWTAVQRSWLLFATPAAIAGLLVALAAWVILGYFGWESSSWQPAPRESRPIGPDTPYAVRFEGFELQRGDVDSVTRAQSQVSWLDGRTVLMQDTVSAQRPSRLGPLAVRQTGFVPDVTLRGWDASGEPLVLQQAGEDGESLGEAHILFPSAEARPLLFVPSEDLYVALAFQQACAGGRPELQVDVLRNEGTGPEMLARLGDSDYLSFDGIKLDIDLDYRPILRLDYRPASGVILVALFLALGSMAIAWLLPPRLIWIHAGQDAEGLVVLRVRPLTGPGVDGWLPDLVEQLREAISDVS
jgi:hypothetical protein